MLLRYKRPPPGYPPYFKDTWKDGKNQHNKGKGGFVRGACLIQPQLKKPELDFIEAALPLLPVHDGMCKPRPPVNCITEEEVGQMRKLLQKLEPFPDSVKNHLLNACFECGVQGHYSRFCPVTYGATKAMTCVDFQYGKPDMLKGQEARERNAEKQRKDEEEEEKKQKAKEKKKKKTVTHGSTWSGWCWNSFTSYPLAVFCVLNALNTLKRPKHAKTPPNRSRSLRAQLETPSLT